MQIVCVCGCTRDCVCVCVCPVCLPYFLHIIISKLSFSIWPKGKRNSFFASREYAKARVSLHECVRINTRELNHTIPLCPSLFPKHHKVHMQVTSSYWLKVKHRQFQL